MRINKFTIFIIFICIGCLCLFISLSGCVNSDTNSGTNLSTVPPVANGHVYLDGKVVSGAIVEAIAINGTDRQSTTTDDKGAYLLNITSYTKYNVTATYQGLRHTIWPVYLEDKTDTYNITLTTMPRSTIEGTGFTMGDTRFKVHFIHCAVNLKSTKDNTTFSKHLNSDGNYSVEVGSNVPYMINGTIGGIGSPPIAQFYYHNYPAWLGGQPQITIGPNETALIDVGYVLP